MIGSRVVAEAVQRGHEVTGITRLGGALPAGVQSVRGNAGDPALAKDVASQADVVVSAIGPSRTGAMRDYLDQLRVLTETLGGTRLIVVGGSGSLLMDGKLLVESPQSPEMSRDEALIGIEALEYVRALGDSADWTFLCAAPMIQPGERTGAYNTSADFPAGFSISAEDYAVALLDEIEEPAHRRKRFTCAD